MIIPTQRVLLITYELKTVGRNYTPLYEALKVQGVWSHYLESTWLIQTTKSPQEVYTAIVGNITTSDRLFIIPVVRPYFGYMPKEVWDWLDQHLPK